MTNMFSFFTARGTSRDVVLCHELRESSNRLGVCSVKKPRSLMWFTPEKLRSQLTMNIDFIIVYIFYGTQNLLRFYRSTFDLSLDGASARIPMNYLLKQGSI